MSALLYAWCFFFPALCAFGEKFRYTAISKLFFWLFYFFLILFIGLRFEVGADWDVYLLNMSKYGDFSWAIFGRSDNLGYNFLNSVSNSLGYGIWLPNLVCAFIFCTGLVLFCRRMPNMWLALAVSIPYIVIVLSMNYTRQSAAFGFTLIALNLLFDRRLLGFIICIFAAVLFHASAIIILFFGILIKKNLNFSRKMIFILVIIVAIYLFYNFFIENRIDSLFNNYIHADLISEGAEIRLALNCLPAAIFLLFKSRFTLAPHLRRFWTWWAISVLCLIPVLIIASQYAATTIVDRFNLYLTPIQIFVCSHLPMIFKGEKQRLFIITCILTFYAISMYVWLIHGNYSESWIPYDFYPLEYF